jgi:hypothetical protein
MLPLYQEVQEYAADNSLSLLGGCRSAEFIPKMSSPNHPVIASRVRSYGPQNTYLLIQILEEMSTAPSWAELSSRIEQKSEKAREFVFPE